MALDLISIPIREQQGQDLGPIKAQIEEAWLTLMKPKNNGQEIAEHPCLVIGDYNITALKPSLAEVLCMRDQNRYEFQPPQFQHRSHQGHH